MDFDFGCLKTLGGDVVQENLRVRMACRDCGGETKITNKDDGDDDDVVGRPWHAGISPARTNQTHPARIVKWRRSDCYTISPPSVNFGRASYTDQCVCHHSLLYSSIHHLIWL